MTAFKNITAVILAGGMGTRLREVVADRPKVMAEVNDRPFLSYLLDYLAGAGIRQVVLCTGYMAERVSEAFGENYLGMKLIYSREETQLGTAGALRLALPLIFSDPVMVLNGDSFCGADLGCFLGQHVASNAKASLLLTRVMDVSRYGAVEIEKSGMVTSFVEKGFRQGDGLINAGIYLLSRSVIAAIVPETTVSLEHEVFQSLIGKGLFGFHQEARFIDIGLPDDYRAAGVILHACHLAALPGENI